MVEAHPLTTRGSTPPSIPHDRTSEISISGKIQIVDLRSPGSHQNASVDPRTPKPLLSRNVSGLDIPQNSYFPDSRFLEKSFPGEINEKNSIFSFLTMIASGLRSGNRLGHLGAASYRFHHLPWRLLKKGLIVHIHMAVSFVYVILLSCGSTPRIHTR